MRQRLLAALVLCLGLSGCAQDGLVGGLVDLGQAALTRGPEAGARIPQVSPARLARTKGQLLYANIERRGSDTYLQPVAANGPVVTWITRSGRTLSTRGTVLVATRGLGADLISARVDEFLVRRGRAKSGGGVFAARTHRVLDGEDQLVATTWICELIDRGTETIPWPTGARAARRLDEVCADGAGGGFTNSYWQSPGGRQLRARQWVGPEAGHVNLYLLQGGA